MNAQPDDAGAVRPLILDRRRAWHIMTLLVIALSLHVVPQMLKAWIPPGLSMVALMLVDALAFAALLHSRRTLRLAGFFAVMFVVVYISRQQNLVALPSIALNGGIAIAFGLTLLPRRTPMIHIIAEWAMAPDPITPEFAHYLRRQTQAWTMFFILMGVICAVLALAAPFSWWSLFANVLSWPLIGAFFCGEYFIRRVWFPHLPPHTPLQTIAAALAFPGEALRRVFERS